MDKLKKCAVIFKYLLNIQYKIKLGRKGKLTEFNINFKECDFHHLVGLQKLKDISRLKAKREKVFNDILEDRISYEMISSSPFFEKDEGKNIIGIKERIDYFLHITELLDSNNIYFKYSQNRNASSNIQCEYILENKYLERIVYILLDKRTDCDYRYCRSFFPKDKKDYIIRQTRMTLLYKEKKNLLSGESIVQLNKLKKDL
ncbi:PBECR4 domain-containing protein [Clostridium coskatii]|uniref:Phage-Barnase-EndoU-ColicinE5/D-RelE like nuclease 4 domain-containing protein n=1 Tax=Clostridium coskatii TaxID=1705578 RepID=A0A168MWA1_9CLOT|nr:PBECR4 domain-containing protein [Clostridium coskatii]OAA85389.1 hypothetical protein WX73_03224 [Clostridium coskatii]OBR91363.1 hypothetical protein CLCOS_35120 [Clostridium coskatii]